MTVRLTADTDDTARRFVAAQHAPRPEAADTLIGDLTYLEVIDLAYALAGMVNPAHFPVEQPEIKAARQVYDNVFAATPGAHRTRTAAARRAASRHLNAHGWSSVAIGRHLNIDHTTVLNALGRTSRKQVAA